MNVPVWARRLQTVPAPIRRDSALPNLYDLIVIMALAALGILLAKGAAGIRAPISALDVSPISLDPAYLPGYALRSTLRMFAAIGAIAWARYGEVFVYDEQSETFSLDSGT
jgi:NitT/TauT family transport system permease protein